MIKEENVKIVGKETISTIFGNTESIVVSKNINESKRNTLTWYSINNDYIPVVVEQYRIDEHKFTASLIEFKD
jgi:ribosomal protein L30E